MFVWGDTSQSSCSEWKQRWNESVSWHGKGFLALLPSSHPASWSSSSHSMSSESSVQMCTGKDLSGNPCVCLCHAPDSKQDANEIQRCRNCSHWDTCHLVGTLAIGMSKVQSILSIYKSGKASEPKVLLEEAVKEANAGLHAGKQTEDREAHGHVCMKQPLRASVSVWYLGEWGHQAAGNDSWFLYALSQSTHWT